MEKIHCRWLTLLQRYRASCCTEINQESSIEGKKLALTTASTGATEYLGQRTGDVTVNRRDFSWNWNGSWRICKSTE